MGYEVVYKCHEKVEGEYNRDETKSFKKKVGDPFEEVPLERLAGAIMAQLARRDVWIVDVEVYELSKKQISFKEAKGGIILKNKKFLFDGGGAESSTIIVEDMMEKQAPPPPQQYAPQQYPNAEYSENVNIAGRSPDAHPHNNGVTRRPVDWVVFSPELPQMAEVKQKNIRFTPDKKYPVFEKRPSASGMGEVFVMLDDTGREQLVSDKYFVPGNIQLFADKELGFSESQQSRDGGNLYWGGANNEPGMPDIRRR